MRSGQCRPGEGGGENEGGKYSIHTMHRFGIIKKNQNRSLARLKVLKAYVRGKDCGHVVQGMR